MTHALQSGSVFEAVASAAGSNPNAPALSFGDRTWRYAELIEAAERLAQGFHSLASHGPIAVLGDNHAGNVLAWLAAMRTGALTSLPNSLLKAEELAPVLDNLTPTLLIVGDAHVETVLAALAISKAQPQIVLRDAPSREGLPTLDDLIANHARYQSPYPNRDQPAELSYTSGTTSTPKGVVLTHDTLLFRAEREIDLLGLTSQDAALVATPLFHQSGIRNTVLNSLLVGAHVRILPRFEAATYLDSVREHGATYAFTVETMLMLLMRRPATADDRKISLRRVIGGGAPEIIEAFRQRFGVHVITGWGMTEAGLAMAAPLDVSDEKLRTLRGLRSGASFAGWPLPGVEARVVDANGCDMPADTPGELLIRSRMVMQGYHRQPQATSEALRDGWLHTGDLAVTGADGAFWFIDRLRDVIRRGGENVAARQVEDVLNAHPAVERAAVVAVPDPVFMQEIKAVIQCKSGFSPTPNDLWKWCRDKLADYKIPRYIEFRDALPVNGSGRLQKQLLKELPSHGTYDRRAEQNNHA